LICTFSDLAQAQSTTGSIVGQITDPTHALVPKAEIVATSVQTGVSYNATSDAQGNYAVRLVPPGSYSVTVTKAGFEKATIKDVLLAVDQKQLLNFELKVGAATEEVTVTAAPPMLQTESVETGDVIQSEQISNLPLLGRHFYDLTALSAGVTGGSGSMNSFNFSVNGQREYANSIMIDGVESTTNRSQDITATPSVDAVEEFKVSTSAYSAEFGRAAGGVVSIQTKSGTNALHGSAYEYFRPNFTAAKQFGFDGQKMPSPNLKQHNFGGTFGGPIRKDKTFFFVSYEQSINSSSYNYVDSTPPLNQVKVLPNGDVDLSGLVDPLTGTQIPIYDPNVNFACPSPGTCTPVQFAGNIIPANRVSKAGLNTLLNFFAMPNLPGKDNGWFNNFLVNSPNTMHNRMADARLDHNFSDNDRLSAVYHYGYSDQLIQVPYFGHTVVKSADDADQGNYQTSGAQEVSVSEVHTFSPRLLNEARVGYTRYDLNQFSPIQNGNLSSQYGMGGISVPGFPATQGYPDIFLYSGYLTGGSSYKPLYFRDHNYQISDTVTYAGFSRHELKFGGDFRLLNSYPNFSTFPTGFQYYQGSYGGLSMTSDPRCGIYFVGCNFSAWDYSGGSELADLILGLPASVYMGLQLTNPHTKSWEMHYFAADTFKVTPRLTLSYGLRYEYQAPYTEADNNFSNYDPTTQSFLLAGRGGNSSALIQSNWSNFGPRAGAAFQLNSKTVLRGGYGLYFSPENDGREDILARNYPFGILQQYSNNPYVGGAYQYQLDTGVQRSTVIPIPAGASQIQAASIPQGKLLTAYTINPNLKTGTSQLFNVTLERQLSSSLTANVAYVGSTSHDLAYEIGDINTKDPNTGNRPNANLGKIQALTDLGWANYNSLQAKLIKRVSANLNFSANYTWSHNIDNGAAPFNLGVNNNYPQNPNNLNAEIASADSDARHTFVFSGGYRLPFGHGQRFLSGANRAVDLILGGWQVNSILSLRTGLPVNIVRGASLDTCPGVRPNLVGDPSGPGTLSEWFNTKAFDATGLNGCDPGNAGRNLVRGPGYGNLDASIFKEFKFAERFLLQTRLEAFNATNSPHFANPDGILSDGTFGQVKRVTGPNGGMRVVQLAVKLAF
jgi:hypothetical protein